MGSLRVSAERVPPTRKMAVEVVSGVFDPRHYKEGDPNWAKKRKSEWLQFPGQKINFTRTRSIERGWLGSGKPGERDLALTRGLDGIGGRRVSVRGRSLGRDLLGRNVLADETEEWREAAREVCDRRARQESILQSIDDQLAREAVAEMRNKEAAATNTLLNNGQQFVTSIPIRREVVWKHGTPFPGTHII